MAIEWAELNTWTPEQERRLRWFKQHVLACGACDLYPEDPETVVECDELRRYWSDPTFPAAAGAAAGPEGG